jgi:hypothetical protein
MSVSGLCEVCQRPDVDHTCDRCGQLVCDRHFDEETGVCVECASEVGRPGGVREEEGGEDLPDGVDTYQF